MSSPTVLEKLAAYVPAPVARSIYKEPLVPTKPTAQRSRAVVLFSDISGFTPLSEKLSQSGPTGTEELTHIINRYFTRMIETTQKYRGQVVKFSGDALTVIFTTEDMTLSMAARYAGECALAMQSQMKEFTKESPKGQEISLSMKVAIGAGELLTCQVGGSLGRWEYLVAGEPLVQVAMAERFAKPGQIIFSPQAWAETNNFLGGQPILEQKEGFVLLERVVTTVPLTEAELLDWSTFTEKQCLAAEKALQCYIPGAIKARLNEQAEWLSELRRMTILFANISGFDYTADDIVDRMQRFVKAVQDLVYSFEGALNKVAVDDKGTVLLLLFGAPPFSHEDDARRTVACALDLQKIAQEQKLHISIGITEGPIFAGPVGAPNRREYTVIGDQVNLAARLMQYSDNGATIVSDRVRERAGPHFIFEDLGLISLKGKTQNILAFRVQGEQDAQDEFVIRHLMNDSVLIGREKELGQIRQVARRSKDGQMQLLLLEGELGLGKSRLASELVRDWVTSGARGYGGKCISYGRQTPYQAWREMLGAIYGIKSNLSLQQQIARLVSGVASLPDPPGQPDYWNRRVPLLAEVVGIDMPENSFTRGISGQLRRNNTFVLLEAILRDQANRGKLLLLLEDIQWADELSLALIRHLATTLTNTSTLLVLVYRPFSEEMWPALQELKTLPYTHRVELKPLPTEESRKLLKTLLGERRLMPDTEDGLLHRCQGNPFFLQENTRAVLDVLANRENEIFSLSDLNLPDTIQDVILARVDQLSEIEKVTLKVSAVLGSSFARKLLFAVHPTNEPRYGIVHHLNNLKEQDLLDLKSASPEWEYTFRNVVTQEVVYESLLMTQRRQLHNSIGEALERLESDEVEQLAFHYGRSNDLERAVKYLTQAARKAQREYANRVAIEHYSEILSCLSSMPDQSGRISGLLSTDYWDSLMERAKLYNLIGERDNELEDLGTLGIIAEALGGKLRRALMSRQWAYFYAKEGDYENALDLIERSVKMAEEADEEKLVGEGYNYWGKLLYLCRQYDTAQEYLQKALLIAQTQQDKDSQADCLNNLGMVAHFQADFEVALYFYDEAMKLWNDFGNQVGQAHTMNNQGKVYYDIGQYQAALDNFDRAIGLNMMVGDRTAEALTRNDLGRIYRTLGDFKRARQFLEEALAIYQVVGDSGGEANSLCQLGFLHGRLESYDTAAQYLDGALDILRERDDLWTLGYALTYYGWLLIDQADYEQAAYCLQEARQIHKESQQKHLTIEAKSLLAELKLSLDELDEAVEIVQEIWQFLDEQAVLGLEHPGRVYLICYRVWEALGDTDQAEAARDAGQNHLQTLLELIAEEPLRESFRENISENRKLLTL